MEAFVLSRTHSGFPIDRSFRPGLRCAYPGLLDENFIYIKVEDTGEQEGEPQNKAHAKDATALSRARGGRKADSFAERQQPAEGAPLMRKSLAGCRYEI